MAPTYEKWNVIFDFLGQTEKLRKKILEMLENLVD